MAWWEWLLGLVMFVIMFGILIAVHEAGHLAAAKLFRVYCFDYSIGFGPKVYQTKRKGGETTFTIRAVPLGGFVSMFGEGVELEKNEYVAPSRNLEGVARYKRAIIFSAGIILNFIMGLILLFVSNVAFTHAYTVSPVNLNDYQSTLVMSIDEDKKDENFNINNKDALVFGFDPVTKLLILDYEVEVLNDKGEHIPYVLTMKNNLSKTKQDPSISDDVVLYPGNDNLTEEQKNAGMKYGINIKEPMVPDFEISVDIDISYIPAVVDEATQEYSYDVDNVLVNSFKLTSDVNAQKWNDLGLNIKIFERWYSFGESVSTTWDQFTYANKAIFQAIGNLFVGSGWDQVGGPVAILQQTTMAYSSFGLSSYLYLWGFISVNLAIFNLLPFPGLDGWALLVVIVESITKKKFPTKVKNIISTVGLLLLFALMVLVLFKDIFTLF